MRKFVLLSVLLLSFIGVKAQESIGNNYKNSIQFNLVDAAVFGSFKVSYERAITENTTVLLGIGLKPSGGLLTIDGFDSPTIKSDDLKFTGFAITPEYRWYFQKKAQKRTGLYVGGYYRFKDYSSNLNGTYTSSKTNTSSPMDIELGMQTHTIGAVLGYKVMLGKQLYIDILIAGPGYTSLKVDITENKPLPPEFYADAGAVVLENYDTVLNLVKDVDAEEITNLLNSKKRSIGLPAFRYGFKIGFSF